MSTCGGHPVGDYPTHPPADDPGFSPIPDMSGINAVNGMYPGWSFPVPQGAHDVPHWASPVHRMFGARKHGNSSDLAREDACRRCRGLAGCALRECVTAERTVGAPAAPQSPFERDETAGSLLEATLLARSQTCTSASPATIVGALARVKDCEAPGAPRGEGRVRLSYSMSGELVSAVVDQAPFAGTQVAGCVEAKFRGTRIRPYQGADLVLERRFLVP